MLEFEDENRETVRKAFGPQITCVEGALRIGEKVFDSLKEHLDERRESIDTRTGTVVLLVFFQLLRRCRASVLVWEYGYAAESEVLTRSLFETHLSARFIIEPKVPQPHWSAQLRTEFQRLCDLSGDVVSKFTDINFRALLYAASQTLKRDSKTDKIKMLPGLWGTLPADFGDKMREAARQAEAEIGPEWAEQIRKTGKFHGFSQVRLLWDHRNEVVHELADRLASKGPTVNPDMLREAIEVITKIDTWFIREIEIPTNPDFDGVEIDPDGVASGRMLILQLIYHVASGNDEFLQEWDALHS